MSKYTITSLLITITACLFISFGLSSCKKESDNPAMGTFYFHIHSNIDTSEIDQPGKFYTDANGRKLALSKAKFYVSNVVLQNANGIGYGFTNAYILTGLDSEEYIIGRAPVGTYTGVSFTVGLNGIANATTPSSHTSGPLSDATTWYGSTAQGYKFMELVGQVDTSTAHNLSGVTSFSVVIGSAANLESVNMPARTGAYAPYVLTKEGTQYIHIIADYGKLLSTITFRSTANTPAQNTTDSYNIHPELASDIANNIFDMFSYEE